MVRKPGFYFVIVQEFGGPYKTIGLWSEFGSWLFAEGDGCDTSVSFDIIEVDEKMIMGDREYKSEEL